MLLAMAWRNLWRRPARTWLSVASMAFASALLVFMLSFQLGSYATMKSNALKIFDGYAQIQPKGYADDPDVRKTIEAPEALVKQVEAVPGVTAAAPRASSYVILANGEVSYGAAIAGVDPAREPRVSTIAGTVRQGRYLKSGDAGSIILGDVLAKNLGVKLGDQITLLGSAADGTIAADSLRLVGVFHTGIAELDGQVAEMPLARFQEDFALGDAVNLIALVGRDLPAVNRQLGALRAIAEPHALVVQDWGALQPGMKQAITLDFSTGLLWYASLVVVVAFIILNTLLMSVLERTREFGMLLAIGMRSDRIGAMMWAELVLLALIGNGLGILVGGAVSLWFAAHGIAFSGLEGLLAQWGLPGRLYPEISPASILSGPLAIIASIALGGLFPFLRIRRLRPVEAMGAA
ncbi:ABC transporter permease [Phenylobacterium sp.]|uniref:ABC transporter permease n=1 Tax=Phenylobacterium sp. TaxID=1871053 RepID=UPI0035AE9A0B